MPLPKPKLFARLYLQCRQRSCLTAGVTQSSRWANIIVLIDRLRRALAADLPMLARDGGFIAHGYTPALDELITLRDDSRRLIAALQQKYCEIGGVSNLKIRHNNVIGYYVEVSPTQADKLMAQKELFIHRQSLASAVRFTTIELGELERKITEAADRALAVELQLYADLVQDVLQRPFGTAPYRVQLGRNRCHDGIGQSRSGAETMSGP